MKILANNSQMHSYKNFSNISFSANINTNFEKVEQCLAKDKFFNDLSKQKIRDLLRQIEGLCILKEKSNVEILPRLDNNQLNLIAKVGDFSNTITTIIKERSARKIATDTNFATRYFNAIKQSIINVETTSFELNKISEFIQNSKIIKDSGFINNLYTPFLEQLNKGNNPAKRIIEILKRIDNSFQKPCIVAIKNIKTYGGINKRSCVRTNFSLTNEKGEKLTPISYLLKDPIDNLFQ